MARYQEGTRVPCSNHFINYARENTTEILVKILNFVLFVPLPRCLLNCFQVDCFSSVTIAVKVCGREDIYQVSGTLSALAQ